MTGRRSAGLLMYRRVRGRVEVFLVHPGGPYFARKDEGYWGVPKGEIEDGEEPLAVAVREFEEETGQPVSRCATGDGFLELGSVRQKSGKVVRAWAFEGRWPEGEPLVSNTVSIEWPPRSGRTMRIPEVDRGELFPLDRARAKIHEPQETFLDRLLDALSADRGR